MMHVAIVHYQLKRHGGLEFDVAELARGLVAAGDTVDIWARQIDGEFAASLPATVLPISAMPLPRLFRNLQFSRAVTKLALEERYDVVLSFARTARQDILVSGGTHLGYLYATGKRASLKDRLDIRLERRAVVTSKFIVAHSRRLKREYEQLYGVDASRVHVVYPPIDISHFVRLDMSQRRTMREKMGLKPDEFAFLFPSTGHKRKGLPALFAAFEQLRAPNARLLVAGRPVVVPHDARIRSLGFIKDMPALYSAVDYTVLPSVYEPFGRVIAESLQCGTPVIAAADSGAAELMEDNDGALLEHCDSASVLLALCAAVDHPARPEAGWASRHGLATDNYVRSVRQLCGR